MGKLPKLKEIAPFNPLFGHSREQVFCRGWYFAGDFTVSLDFPFPQCQATALALIPTHSLFWDHLSQTEHMHNTQSQNTTHTQCHKTDTDLQLPKRNGSTALLHICFQYVEWGISHACLNGWKTPTHTHLIEFVDIDLTLFISLWAHVHRSSYQKNVCVIVTVDVMRLENTAEIWTDLRTRYILFYHWEWDTGMNKSRIIVLELIEIVSKTFTQQEGHYYKTSHIFMKLNC